MPKRKPISFLVLILTLLLVGAVVLIKNIFIDKSLFIEDKKQLEIERELTSYSYNSVIYNGNDFMVEGEGQIIRAMKMEGSILWSMKLEGNIENIMGCGKDLLVNLQNNNIIILSRAGEILWNYKVVEPPSDIFCSSKGLILVQYNEEDGNYFEIFNTKGIKYCHGNIDSAQVVAFDGYGDERFTLSLIDISKNNIITKLVTYDNKGQIIWGQDFEDEIVSFIKYSKRGEIIIISEDAIIKFRKDGKMIKQNEHVNPLIKASINDELIVTIEENKGYYDLFAYDLNLNQIGTAAVKSKPEGVYAGNKYFLIYDEDNLTLFSRRGKIIGLYQSNIDINRAYMDENSHIYIVSNRRLQRLSF